MEYAPGRRATQWHLEHAVGVDAPYLDTISWGNPVDPATHAKGLTKEYPDVYVNGDVTVTIDPIKNAHWIRDTSHRHAASAHRGALKDHAGVMRAMYAIDHPPVTKFSNPYPETTFIPTSAMIDPLPKLTPRCILNSTRGHRGAPSSANYGQLPSHRALIYANALPDRHIQDVERDVWNEFRTPNRAFDCGGMCR